MIKASWWQALNGCLPLKISFSSCGQYLFISWHKELDTLFLWKLSFSREHCNSLQKELLVFSWYYVGLERRDHTLSSIDCFVWGSKRWEIWLRLDLKEFWCLLSATIIKYRAQLCWFIWQNIKLMQCPLPNSVTLSQCYLTPR